MSQLNANFQELIATNNNNNNGLDNVAGTTILTSEALQGFSVANQFAICAGPGNAPVLLSCLAPMFVPTLTNNANKSNFEIANQDNRSNNQSQPQTVQIQLASPFNLANNNLVGNQSLPSLGLSYINLSSLGAAQAGGAIPIQITLNNPNQHLQIPSNALTGLNQEIQLAQNYQVKYEPDLGTHQQLQQQQGTVSIIDTTQQQQQQQQQQSGDMKPSNNQQVILDHHNDTITTTSAIATTTTTSATTTTTTTTKRKQRRRIPNKTQRAISNNTNNSLSNGNTNTNNTNNSESQERLHDHKGRPFIYSCSHCPKKFTLNSRLTAHLRCHTGIRPYTCVQCGFSFTQKSYLIRHAAVHTEERPFTCERCLKTYKHYGSLANHRKLHRKEDKALEGDNDDLMGHGVGVGNIEDNGLIMSNDQQPDWQTGSSVTMVTMSQESIMGGSSNTNSLIANGSTTGGPTYLGTGPATFPDQQQQQQVTLGNNDQIIVSSNNTSPHFSSALLTNSNNNNNNSTNNNSSIFLDLQQMTQNSQQLSTISTTSNNVSCTSDPINNNNNNTIIYTTQLTYPTLDNSNNNNTNNNNNNNNTISHSHLQQHLQPQQIQHHQLTYNTSSAM